MAVLLDTATVPRADRHELAVTALKSMTGSTAVAVGGHRDQVSARLETWAFGPAAVIRAEATGLSLGRRARAGAAAPEALLAIGVQQVGTGRHQHGAVQRTVGAGEGVVVDRTGAFDYSWSGYGASSSLLLPLGDLALPADVIHRGSVNLPASPLYRMLCRHVLDMTRHADALSGGSQAHGLGVAAVELGRALVATAAGDGPHAREATAASLVSQLRAHVSEHLSDPDLGAESIAAALHVSRRHLYALCAGAGISLEQWVLRCRLEAARAELVEPRSSHRPISLVARRWGFKDATHFGRRFRDAYGLLPSDWRRAAGGTETQPERHRPRAGVRARTADGRALTADPCARSSSSLG